jgi:hypothetical protein
MCISTDDVEQFLVAAKFVLKRKPSLAGNGLCCAIKTAGCEESYSIMTKLFGPMSYDAEDMQRGVWTATRMNLLILICEMTPSEIYEIVTSPHHD